MRRFQLPFPRDQAALWARRYAETNSVAIERRVISQMQHARASGTLSKPAFVAACRWKSPRPAARARRNRPALVQDAWEACLASRSATLRAHALTVLDGVSWRTATALLHLAWSDAPIQDGFPLQDVRALTALGVPAKDQKDTPQLWEAYVAFCRKAARACDVSLRDLDRALWQWDKEGGPARRARALRSP